MGDSKVAAMMFLFLGAFLFWLQTQGKLIPLMQQLFGEGLYGQKIAAAGTAAVAAPAAGVSVNLGSNPSLLTILSAIPGIVNGKMPGANPVPISSPLPAPTPPSGSTGTLPGFPSNLPGASPPSSSGGYTELPPQSAYNQLDANGNPI